MARQYAFTFREGNGNGLTVVVRGFGNTKGSAERSARSTLRRDHGVDPTRFYTARVDFVRGAPS